MHIVHRDMHICSVTATKCLVPICIQLFNYYFLVYVNITIKLSTLSPGYPQIKNPITCYKSRSLLQNTAKAPIMK